MTAGGVAPRRPRVVAIASHPIQYQAPLFRALAQVPWLDFRVLFIQLPDAVQQGKGFGVAFQWDVPVLEGYAWEVATDVGGPGGLQGFRSARLRHPRALLRGLGADAVLLTGWHAWPLVQLLLAARSARVPVIMRGEANALRARPVPVRWLHRLLLGACAAFLPIGRASRAFYEGYGIAPRHLFDTPYFVDNERFASSAAALAPQRAALRERWGIAPGAVCFCYAGKLEPKKRIGDLLDALRLAAARSPGHMHLLVVGHGELMDTARAAVARDRLPVTFAGFLNQSEITAAYAACDCLVLPSDYGETWGLVVNEAMACGRPAIVSDRVGCGPDLVTPGVTGFVFPFGDTAALAEALLAAAADPQRLAAMGQAARERVERRYSVERSVEGTLAAVRDVLGLA